MCDMKYVRYKSIDGTTYFSDILSKSCILYTDNKVLREKNGFLIKGQFVYVYTIHGLLGVHFNNSTGLIGERVVLTRHIPNLVVVKSRHGYKFKVGKRYLRVSDNRCITLTVFKKLATPFLMSHVKIVECRSYKFTCIINALSFKWITELYNEIFKRKKPHFQSNRTESGVF